MIINGITQEGNYFTRITLSYEEIIERVRARIAQLNHNLVPIADISEELVSWSEKLDVPLLKFCITASAERIASRLSAWQCKLDIYPWELVFTFEFTSDKSKFNTLLQSQISEIIYQRAYADKLTLGSPSLRSVLRSLHEGAAQTSEGLTEDLLMTMSILEN